MHTEENDIHHIYMTQQSKSKMCHYCSLFRRVMDLGIQLNPWLEYCLIHFVHVKIYYTHSTKLKNNYKTLQETKVNVGSITMGLLKKVTNFGAIKIFFYFLKKLKLFNKEALNWSKVRVKTFVTKHFDFKKAVLLIKRMLKRASRFTPKKY